MNSDEKERDPVAESCELIFDKLVSFVGVRSSVDRVRVVATLGSVSSPSTHPHSVCACAAARRAHTPRQSRSQRSSRRRRTAQRVRERAPLIRRAAR